MKKSAEMENREDKRLRGSLVKDRLSKMRKLWALSRERIAPLGVFYDRLLQKRALEIGAPRKAL